jgi:hypothetical protein
MSDLKRLEWIKERNLIRVDQNVAARQATAVTSCPHEFDDCRLRAAFTVGWMPGTVPTAE